MDVETSDLTELVPRTGVVLSVIEARLAEFDSDTAPPNELAALVMVIALAPALKLAVVAVVIAPDCVSAPLEIAASEPTELVPRSSGVLSVIEARLAEFDSDSGPPNELAALVMVIALAPALKLAAPGTVSAPVCVIAPEAITVRSCPTDEAASDRPVLSVICTLFAPVLVSVTAAWKSLPALVSVIAFAPALKLATPVAVTAALCVIAPLEIAASCPTEEAPKLSGVLSVIEARFAPEFDSDTSPPNELAALVMVIALAPAVKLAVVAVVIAPDCVSAPLEIAAGRPTGVVPRSSAVFCGRASI